VKALSNGCFFYAKKGDDTMATKVNQLQTTLDKKNKQVTYPTPAQTAANAAKQGYNALVAQTVTNAAKQGVGAKVAQPVAVGLGIGAQTAKGITAPQTAYPTYSAPAPNVQQPQSARPTENKYDIRNIQYPIPDTPVQQAPSTPDYNPWTNPQTYYDMAMRQFESKKLSSLNALRDAYAKATAELQGQIPGIEQAARQSYDANDAYYYTQALPELRAAMEQAGLYAGGDMLKGNIDLLTMRGQNLGQINQEKANQIGAIQRAIAQMQAEQPLKEAELQASLDAEALQAALDAANAGLQNQLSVANLMGTYNGMPTLNAIQQAYEQAMGIADRTGVMPDGTQTLAARNLDESVRQFNLQYGLDLRQMNLAEAEQKLNEKVRLGQLSLDEKAQALNQAKYLYQQAQDAAQRATDQRQYNSAMYQQYYDQVFNMLNESSGNDALGRPVKKYTPDQIIAYVSGLPLTWEEKAQILNSLGIE
jgi:hypothetical protein